MKVPLLDLKAQYRALKPALDRAMIRVAESQDLILGPNVEAFEQALAEYCRCRYAVGVSSGTDALLLALMAAGVGPGDEVITTPFTFFATAGSVARLGARPVFVDIRPDTFNLDPALLEAAVTPRTRAVIPVHLYGQCAPMGPIMEVAGRHGLAVIEDAAQAIGAEDPLGRACSMGQMGCLSFYPTKNLGAFGQGGAVTTNDEALYGRLRALRQHGARETYLHEEVGGNFRLDAIQGAVLAVKLAHLDSWTAARQDHAAQYDRLLDAEGLAGGPITPPRVTQPRHVFNLYTIRARDRDGLRCHLADEGIGTGVYYPLPLHLQPCFKGLGYREGDLPEAERASREVLSLPVYPELSDAQIRHVVEAVGRFYAKR